MFHRNLADKIYSLLPNVDMTKTEFIDLLTQDKIFLRHHTITSTWEKIKKSGYLKPNYTDIQEYIDDGIIDKSLIPIKAVYFQLVKGIVPRFENDEYMTELWFKPEIINLSDFVFHPIGWHFGLSDKTPQYASGSMSQYSNVSLKYAYNNIQYDNTGEEDEMNEILLLTNIPLSYLVHVM